MPRAVSFVRVAAISLGIAGVLVTSLATAPAFAQGKDLAQLRQIFADGRAAEDGGKWAEALAKFKEVAAEKMTPQVRFHIALCEENMGKLVSAKRGFELAAAEGTQAGSSAVEVPPAAKQHADALAARIAKLEIDVKGKLVTSKIVLDDAPLAAKDLGVEIEVDPGAHVIEVRDGDGKQTLRKDVTLAEKGTEKIEIPVTDADAGPRPVEQASGGSRLPAYIVGGVGVASLIVSGVFFGLRASDISKVTATCTNQVALTGCSPLAESVANQGMTYNRTADALLGIGLVGVATGVTLFFVLGPKKSATAREEALGPSSASRSSLWIAPSGSGLKVGGAF